MELSDEKKLWDKYLIVTKELLKAINQEDIDMFLDLVDQRQRLMEKLQAIPSPVFAHTEECQSIREQIKPMDMEIMFKARTWLNKSRRNNEAVRGYDVTGFIAQGHMFNRGF